MTQESQADRDAYTAGRDLNIIHQHHPSWNGTVILDALSASGSAQLLAEWCANEATFNDAAFLLATASAIRVGEALKVLLAMDSDLVVALLARINPAGADEVIHAITPHPSWLDQLPAAANEITQCEVEKSADLGPRKGRLTRARASHQDTSGYHQLYRDGLIHWSTRGGAQVTAGSIAEYHNRSGGSGGPLGFPLSEELSTGRSVLGTTGRYQRFESESDYSRELCDLLGVRCGGTVYWSQAHGTQATSGHIGELYELNGGTAGWLGFPLEDSSKVGPYLHGGIFGYYQRFEGGVIYDSTKTGAVAVPTSTANYVATLDSDVAASIGFPVSPQKEAVISAYGMPGQLQRFEGIRDYPRDILESWPDNTTPSGATVYSSSYGIYTVSGDTGVLYERLGGTGSWLGFPTSEEEAAARCGWRTQDGFIQAFEGGAIFRKNGHSPVPVSVDIWNYLIENEPAAEKLGFPVSGGDSLASGEGRQIQFFENGIVTIQGTAIEAWTRLHVTPKPTEEAPGEAAEAYEMPMAQVPRAYEAPGEAMEAYGAPMAQVPRAYEAAEAYGAPMAQVPRAYEAPVAQVPPVEASTRQGRRPGRSS